MTQAKRRIDGLKSISAFLRMSIRRVRNLASPRMDPELRLPLFHLSPTGGKGVQLSAYAEDLIAWEQRFAARGHRPRQRKAEEVRSSAK